MILVDAWMLIGLGVAARLQVPSPANLATVKQSDGLNGPNTNFLIINFSLMNRNEFIVYLIVEERQVLDFIRRCAL